MVSTVNRRASSPTYYILRGGEVVTHQTHYLENTGSNPVPATIEGTAIKCQILLMEEIAYDCVYEIHL